MPKREDLHDILYGRQSYSFELEGFPALLRSDVVTQDELTSGDKVKMFSIPGGKTFISKVEPTCEDAYTVGRLTIAHIYFDDEITVKEK